MSDELTTMELEMFELHYANRSGCTVAFLHENGRWAEPCNCDYEHCTGIRMGFQWNDAIIEDQLRSEGAI